MFAQAQASLANELRGGNYSSRTGKVWRHSRWNRSAAQDVAEEGGVVTEAQVEHTQDFISRRVYLPHVTKKTTYHPKRRNSFPLLHGVFRPSAFYSPKWKELHSSN